jgi:hypothetical protein
MVSFRCEINVYCPGDIFWGHGYSCKEQTGVDVIESVGGHFFFHSAGEKNNSVLLGTWTLS